jgi:translation elongation factor EF-Tu-like GTPase
MACGSRVHVFAPLRDHLNIVFIGHIDAGKSTLAGQILFVTVSCLLSCVVAGDLYVQRTAC